MFFTDKVIYIFAGNFSIEKKELTIKLCRILLPSIIFMMMTGITNSILYSYKKFIYAAFGPSIYNILVSLSLVLFRNYGIISISYGILFSSIIYFFIQLLNSLSYFKNYKVSINIGDKGFQSLTKLTIPALLASSIFQINLFVLTIFTGMLKTGSITAYRNASETWQMPFSIIGMGIGFAMLPHYQKSSFGTGR